MPSPYFTPANTTPRYELRFHFGWYTRGRQPLFANPAIANVIQASFPEIADRYQYHTLEMEVEPIALRALLSLKPCAAPAAVTRAIKGNLATIIRQQLGIRDIWSRGWFVRSNGHVTNATVRNYIASQYDHHRAAPISRPEWAAVAKWHADAEASAVRKTDHAAFEYNVHLVLVTRRRLELLDLEIAEKLIGYVRAVCDQKGWVPWDIEVVWNHVHMFLGLRPDDAPRDVALSLMNNSAWWLRPRYGAAVRMDRMEGIWQPSYYAGSVGSATTAQIKSFLGRIKGSGSIGVGQ